MVYILFLSRGVFKRKKSKIKTFPFDKDRDKGLNVKICYMSVMAYLQSYNFDILAHKINKG